MKICFLLFACFSFSSVYAGQVRPVSIPDDSSLSPQVEIDGAGIGTLGVERGASSAGTKSVLNFENSAVSVTGSERLYDHGIGSFGMGGVTTDQSLTGHEGTAIFLDRMYVDYQSEKMEFLIGRYDQPISHLVEFPTLRDDDLIHFTYPQNPLSNGQHSEEHQYSNQAAFTWNQGLTHFENFHVQHLLNSVSGDNNTDINSFGASYEYMAPPTQENFETLPFLALGYDRILLNSNSTSGLNQFTFGAVFNLRKSVTDLVDVRFQETLGWGSALSTFSSETDTFQANSHQLAVALRYLHQPFGLGAYQLAVVLAHKDYFRVNDAGGFAGTLTAVKQIGQGFDLVAQYQGQKRQGALAAYQAGGVGYEQIFEVGFVFNFALTINPHLSPRRSLLNQSHHYLQE
jgi:hypothetical protein